MSIQAIKAVEIGDGFATAARRGSDAHDEIRYNDDFVRDTNRAGGIEGGMSMGGVIRARAAMKPLSNLMRALQTVDVETKQPDQAIRERSDVCAVPAAGVVAEQMVAIVLAQEMQRLLGGDTVGDMVQRLGAYRQRISDF
jgi:chorismate synthase